MTAAVTDLAALAFTVALCLLALGAVILAAWLERKRK